MCGIVGFTNLKKDLSNSRNVLNNMTNSISSRGPDEEGYYLSNHVALGHRRLIIIDAKTGVQPMTIKHNGNTYTIVYNGQIYNASELKDELKKYGYDFFGYSDTEVLLKSYLHFGSNILERLNGIFAFAIWNEEKQELFLARDHFGIKPLFYTLKNDTLVFGSEIKALFEHPEIEPVLDKTSICELFGIGPAHTPGMRYF